MSKPETGQARTAKSAASESGREESDKVVKSAVKSLTKLKARIEAALAEVVNQGEELEIQLNRTSSNKEEAEKLLSDHVTHLHHLLDRHHYRQQEILSQRHNDFLYQLLVTKTEVMNYERKLAELHEKVEDRLTRVTEHHDVTLAQNANIIPLWNEWNINNTRKPNMQVPRLTWSVEKPQLTASEMDVLVGRFVFLEDSAVAGPLSGASAATVASTPDVSAKVASTPGVSAKVASTPGVSAKVASTPDVSAKVASTAGVSANFASTPGVYANVASTPDVSAKVASTPGVSAKVASTPGVSAKVASTPGVSANFASTPGVYAKVASTPGVSAKVASTPGVSAKVASTPGVPAKVASTPGVSAKVASTPGVPAKVASTPGVSAKVASTPGVSAKVASTPGVSAKVASTPGVSAKVASTPGVSAKVASTPGVSAKVASTPGVSAKVASTPGVSAKVASTPGVSAKVASTPDVSAKVASTPGVSANFASTPGVYANVASTPDVSAKVASTPGVSAKVASTPGVSAKVASTPDVSAKVASTPGVSAKVASTPGVSAKVASTPGVSAKVASTPGVSANVASTPAAKQAPGQGAAHSKRKRTTAQATALLHCQPPANPLKPVWDKKAQPAVPPQPDCSPASASRYLATGGQAAVVKPPSVAAKEVKSVANLLFRDLLERASAESAPPRQRPQPRSIAVAKGAFPIVLPLRRQRAASIAPRKDGKVWVVYGEDQTLCLDLLDRSGIVLSTTEIAEVPRFVACFEDGPVLVVTSDPQHLVELDSSMQQCGELCLNLSLRVTSVSVGVTGIAVSFKNDLCWISTTGQDDSWIITREKNPKLTGICSTAVMTLDGKELVFAAVRGTQEVAIYQKLSVGAAGGAGTFTALPSFRGRQIEGLSPQFMPASISAHDSGFLAVLDSSSRSVAFLNVRKFEMVTVVSRGVLCDGTPTLLAFSRGDGEDEPELWVASASGWLCRTTLCFRYDDELGDVG